MFGPLKDWSVSLLAVLALALGIGLGFRWLYPHVAPSAELAGLFVFVALAIKLLAARLWAWLRRPRSPAADVPPAPP